MNNKQKERKRITFMIGNGFDLNCDLKTKYSDSYEQYLDSPSASDSIRLFKEIMKKEIAQDINTWADFEMSIARHASEMYQKGILIDGLYDYTDFLATYLSGQNDEFKNRIDRSIDSRPIFNMLKGFYNGLPSETESKLISQIVKSSSVEYYILNFNYTDTIDSLLSLVKDYKILPVNIPIIHIHGTLQKGMILGVNDVEQLKISADLTEREKRVLIKPFFNQIFDDAKIEEAGNIILQSDIICIYGLSLGDSDKMWRDLVSDWVCSNPKHQIVYYNHELEDTAISLTNKKLDLCDKAKKQFAINLFGDCKNDIISQIHVPIGQKFFDMNDLLNTSKLFGR